MPSIKGVPICAFLSPKQFVERLTGRHIEALERRAKYLIMHLDDGLGLISHLGMSGSYRIEQDDEQQHAWRLPA